MRLSLLVALCLVSSLAFGSEVIDWNMTCDRSAFDTLGLSGPIKLGLLPGQTATFDNYTSYTRGITGIELTFREYPYQFDGPHFTTDDFSLRVGNSNNLTTWTALGIEPTVEIFPDFGQSYFIAKLNFPDNAVQNEWLEVTLKANEDTGLIAPDVSYFGNAIGESGNSLANAIVSAADEIGARNDPHNILNPADPRNPHDFNRDRLVNAQDQIIARNNATTVATALRLISPVELSLAAAPVPEPSTWVLLAVGMVALLWRIR